MRTRLAALVVLIGGLAHALPRPRLDGREAPRATDLLRAETLSEQAERRLRLPARGGSGWKHGGSGWETATPPAPKGSVTIRVAPPPRRREP